MSKTLHSAKHLSSSQQVLLALKEARAKLEALNRAKTEPIAIIGMGCRFPGGADDAETFWQILHAGVDAVTEVPPERWDIDAYYDPKPETPGKMYTRHGGFLNDVERFDPLFFGISPREAISMDPQQRLLLEVSWEALENAGQIRDRLTGSVTGVFIGITSSEYRLMGMQDRDEVDTYHLTGNILNVAAGRLAYILGLQGPCMAIDTACSSALVALHLACQSLRNGECDQALAGGVNLTLSPEGTVLVCQTRALSPAGRCKTFDASADGYVRGEGCGIVVLKRLSDALADRDSILALIRSSAVNHDGPSSGLTVPNGPAQEAVIRKALQRAKLEPSQIKYVEAHGTGTALGDPIEVRALGAVLDDGRAADDPLIVGSVKTNIGHLESAAGIASVIKVVLALRQQEIPPHLHFTHPSPHIPWDEFNIQVPTTPIPWRSGDRPRLAGVSSFGFSGTNVHLILEEAPGSTPDTHTPFEKERPLHLLTLSAKTEDALTQVAQRYETFLETHSDLELPDISYSARVGRAHHAHRLAIVAASSSQARENLANFLRKHHSGAILKGCCQDVDPPRPAFLFTGQGSQYVNMGRELYETQPTFRRTLHRCAEILRSYLDVPILEILYPSQLSLVNCRLSIDQTAYAQPALFALEYALVKLWQSWGIEPAVVMGHSVGEYAAACIAGVFSLEDGLKLIAARGRLMQSLPQVGAMIAVMAPEAAVTELIRPYEGNVSLAALNGPENLVISGRSDAIQRLIADFQREGIRQKPLIVSHAFHSPLMEPILEDFARVAAEVTLSAPRVDIISNLTGKLIKKGSAEKSGIATPEYWVSHIRQPVRFSAGMQILSQEHIDVFLEIGPKPVLLGMGRQVVANSESSFSNAPIQNLPSEVLWLPSLRPGVSDWQQMLESLGQLYVRGSQIDWVGFDRDYGRRRVFVPTYPFQRQRYWIEPQDSNGSTQRQVWGTSKQKKGSENLRQQARIHPLAGQRLPLAGTDEVRFEACLNADSPSFLSHHQIYETVVLPATAYLEIALAAGSAVFASHTLLVHDVAFEQAMILPKEDTLMVQIVLKPEQPSTYSFRIFSAGIAEKGTEPSWIQHVSGRISVQGESSAVPTIDLDALQSAITEQIPVNDLYQHYQELGLNYGPDFKAIEQLWRQADGDSLPDGVFSGQALARLSLPVSLSLRASDFVLHPVLLDSCFQSLGAIFPRAADDDIYLPVDVERLSVYRRPGKQVWSHVHVHAFGSGQQQSLTADLQLFDHQGMVVARAEGLSLMRVPRETLGRDLSGDIEDWLYHITWPPQVREETQSPEFSRKSYRWLIFADQKKIGQALADQLKEHHQTGILVYAGERFQKTEETHYTLNPESSDDFIRLFRQISATGEPPLNGVLHLWSLDTPSFESLTTESLEQAQVRGCDSVLHIVQTLVRLEIPARLWLVTQGGIAVAQEEDANLLRMQQAPLWGLGKVIAIEHPDLQCTCLDIDPRNDTASISALWEEIAFPDKERQIAWRQGVRYAARLHRLQEKPVIAHLPIDENGSYLVTGGLGALGLHVAGWLVAQGARHVVLNGRHDASAEALDAIAQLEQSGARMTVITADVSQSDDVRAMLDQIQKTLPPLHGIMHIAGIVDDGILLQQDREKFARVMAPKVKGSWLLHTLTREMPLDFFVCFSSTASLLGTPGQGNYAAANAFMDALAHARSIMGLPGLSINWGGWRQIGMTAAMGPEDQDRLVAQGVHFIPPEKGVRALERLLRTSVAQVGVVPVTWQKFFHQVVPGDEPLLFADMAREFRQRAVNESALLSHQPDLRQQLQILAPEERHALVMTYIQEQVSHILRLELAQLNPRQALHTMGLDSLMAIELRNRLRTGVGVDIPIVKFMEGVSVHDLVEKVMQHSSSTETTQSVPASETSETANEPKEIEQMLDPKQARELLAQLDDLNDEEIDALLAAASTEKGEE